MFNRPISAHRLGDTIQYNKFINDDGDKPEFDATITIENVRFQRKTEMKYNNNGQQILLKGKVFIDAVNSTNADEGLFVENSEVIFRNDTYIVHEVREFAPEKNLGVRHWELVLQ